MKLLHYQLLTLLVIFSGCKKDRPQKPDPDPVINDVTITGKTYPSVKIGNLTWTTQNYTGATGPFFQDKPEYGNYYTHAEAAAITLPAGWRIPTMADYIALAESQGITVTNYTAHNQDAIKKLTSVQRWSNVAGSNTSGFNAFPAGYVYNNSAPIPGDIAEFITADGKTVSIQETASHSLRLIFYGDNNNALYKFNVRFVRDN